MIGRLEKSDYTPSIDQLQKLGEVLGFEVIDLFTEEEKEVPSTAALDKKYNIAVAGTGYVGLSIATLLAQHNHVTAVDIVPEKVDLINNRKSPIQDEYIEKYLAEKELDLPDEDTEYEMYEDTSRILQEYGYAQYEISNYARDGYICAHNSGYWKRTEYLGLGLGAASLMPWKGGRAGLRFHNTENMQEYLQWSGCPEKIRKNEILLSVKEQEEEFMFLGLRMTAGVSETEFYKNFKVPIEEVYGEVLEKYRSMGLMEKNKDFWRFTRQGIHVSNQILADFLQD